MMPPQPFGFLPTREFWNTEPAPARVASTLASLLALASVSTLSVIAEGHGPANIALTTLSFFSLRQVGLGIVEKIKRGRQK